MPTFGTDGGGAGAKTHSRSVSTIQSHNSRGKLGKDSAGQSSAEQNLSATSGLRAAKTMGKAGGPAGRRE